MSQSQLFSDLTVALVLVCHPLRIENKEWRRVFKVLPLGSSGHRFVNILPRHLVRRRKFEKKLRPPSWQVPDLRSSPRAAPTHSPRSSCASSWFPCPSLSLAEHSKCLWRLRIWGKKYRIYSPQGHRCFHNFQLFYVYFFLLWCHLHTKRALALDTCFHYPGKKVGSVSSV